MACERCASGNQQKLPAEMTIVFPGTDKIGVSPVYLCVEISVCLDCGYTPLVVPTGKLELLRSGMTVEVRSRMTFQTT
jgi:hypothetical protein